MVGREKGGGLDVVLGGSDCVCCIILIALIPSTAAIQSI